MKLLQGGRWSARSHHWRSVERGSWQHYGLTSKASGRSNIRLVASVLEGDGPTESVRVPAEPLAPSEPAALPEAPPTPVLAEAPQPVAVLPEATTATIGAAAEGFTPVAGFSEQPQTGFEEGELGANDIKAALLDSLYGTERGLAARSEVRAEINELISQLEAKNPTPNPTEVLEKLDGEWRLVYTSNSALLAVLGLGRLPLVTVGDLVQKVESAAMTVENKVNLSGPFSRASFATVATFEVRSPKRLQLKLESGRVSTPELTSDLDLPSSVSLFGQTIDLSQLKDALAPLKDQAQGVLSQVNQLVTQVPDLNIPIQSDGAQTWQLNTYVDDDLRVARGDRGAVFIYSRIVDFTM